MLNQKLILFFFFCIFFNAFLFSALTHHYSFNEGDGDITASEENSPANDASLFGDYHWTKSINASGSLCFKQTGYARIEGYLQTTDFTVCALVMKNDTSKLSTIVSRRTGGDYWFFYIHGPNLIARIWDTSHTAHQVSAGKIETDVWYHVAMRQEDKTLSIFINGVKVNSIDTVNLLKTAGSDLTTRYLTIGSLTIDGNYSFDGNIDDVRIYNSAIDDSEIKSLAANVLNFKSNKRLTKPVANQDISSESSREEKDYTVALADPWALKNKTVTTKTNYKNKLDIRVTAFKKEHIIKVIEIQNTSSQLMDYRIVPCSLILNNFKKTLDGSAMISLHKVVNIGVNNIPTPDALPELRNEDTVTVAPNSKAFIWLNIYTADFDSGSWYGGLEIIPTTSQANYRFIPIDINILPAAIPDNPKPYAFGWANPLMHPFKKYSAEVVIKDFNDYFISGHVIPYEIFNLRSLEFDSSGKLINLPELKKLDEYIDKFGGTNQIYVITPRTREWPKELSGINFNNSIARGNFEKVVKYIRTFFQKKGVGVKNFAWYAADEPDHDKKVEDVIVFGKLMLEVDPEQQLFVTVYSKVTPESLKKINPYVNIWVPKLNMSSEQREIMKNGRKDARFFSYMVLPRSVHPYNEVRSMGVSAFNLGYEGLGIWCYGSLETFYGLSTWHDMETGQVKYSLSYSGSDLPVSSVRKEAWRQAIQDYRYLNWIKNLSKTTKDRTLINESERLIYEMCNNWEKTTTFLDDKLEEARALTLRLLISRNELSPNDSNFELESLASAILLTGNSMHTAWPILKDFSVSSEPPFKDEKEAKKMTDQLVGSVLYRASFRGPSEIVYDFKKNFVGRCLLIYYKEDSPKPELEILCSDNLTKGEWSLCNKVDENWTKINKTDNGAFILNLDRKVGRYFKLKFRGENIQIDEIQILGEETK